MENQYIKLLEQIANLSKHLLEAQDQLAEKVEVSNHWYNQYRELKLKYEPNTEDF